jgi:arsenate reductase
MLPIFPADPERIHWSFEDPSEAKGTEEQQLQVFRRVRDAIIGRLRLFQTVAARF